MASVIACMMNTSAWDASTCAGAEALAAHTRIGCKIGILEGAMGQHASSWRRSITCIVGAMQMCVEMVIAVALRNRDRLLLIWPYVHDFLAAILAPAQVTLPGLQSSQMTYERLSRQTLVFRKCSTPAPATTAGAGGLRAAAAAHRGASGQLKAAQARWVDACRAMGSRAQRHWWHERP